jgi:hypothetical protein
MRFSRLSDMSRSASLPDPNTRRVRIGVADQIKKFPTCPSAHVPQAGRTLAGICQRKCRLDESRLEGISTVGLCGLRRLR